MKKSTLLGVIGACALLVVASFSMAKPATLKRSFDVEQGGSLFIDSDAGSIEVSTHNRDTIEVEVDKRGRNADDFTVTMDQSGDDLKIYGKKSSGNWFSGFSLDVHYKVVVPTRYDVHLRTGGGGIEVANLTGDIDAHTSGGGIRVGDIIGDVDVRTSGGSIKVGEVAGNLKAHTSGGSITAKITKQPTEDSALTTSGGSVTAYLAPGIAVDLEARTSGGSVSSEIPVNGTLKQTRIKGEINGGGPRLKLATSGGSVRIKEL